MKVTYHQETGTREMFVIGEPKDGKVNLALEEGGEVVISGVRLVESAEVGSATSNAEAVPSSSELSEDEKKAAEEAAKKDKKPGGSKPPGA